MFATTDQYGLVAALRIGETFDVEVDVPFNQILHISKYKLNCPSQDFNRTDYRYHVTIDKPINNNIFRITSAYEPGSPQTNSREPFVFGFRIYGFLDEDNRPLWRKYLSDAVIYAQNSDWGFGLLNVAFSVESFIAMSIIQIINPLDLPQYFIEQLLQTVD